MGEGLSPETPAGINPLLYLAIFLLVGPPALLWKFGKPIADWWRNRQQRRADEGKRDSPSYRFSQAEIERIGRDYQRLSKDYEILHSKQDAQDERMSRMENELTTEKQLRWSAIGYIRVLIDSHRKHAPEADVPEPPVNLQKIL